eukprot:TRINITY_DN93069_c0_g1_i1.p1 TRINITY_DN93069_c0_g1~~TRINITY_DN93069_c0_g1_i1.p1  ORF type:complete len:201 (+),score=17.40 TRINITY_DN93069_c0_g1_i1:160-762(+)
MSWRAMLEHSLKSNQSLPYATYLQLATVRPTGRPACRTVVFRGFLTNSDSGLMFCSDTRTDKIPQIQQNQYGQACWYFEDSREQYRLDGLLQVVGPDHRDEALQRERQQMWSNMSDKGRAQFAYPEPGEGRVEDESLFSPAVPPGEEPAMDTFALLILHVEEVDYVSLLDNERKRFAKHGDSWTSQRLNPQHCQQHALLL